MQSCDVLATCKDLDRVQDSVHELEPELTREIVPTEPEGTIEFGRQKYAPTSSLRC